MLGITAEISERQYNDRKTRWRERARGRALGPPQWTGIIPDHSIRPHRAINVLEGLLTQIDELDPSLALGVIVRRRRDTDAAGLCEALESSRDVDAISEDVVRLNDYVTNINANAESN